MKAHLRTGSLLIFSTSILLASCGGTTPPLPLPTIVPAIASSSPPARPSAPIPIAALTPQPTPTATPTPIPRQDTLLILTQQIDHITGNADTINARLEHRLNSGTTLPPLKQDLQTAISENEAAASRLQALTLTPNFSPYQAVKRYVESEAAAYQTTADAWQALLTAAKANGPIDLYQSLATLATAQFHQALVMRQDAEVVLGLAPEGDITN